RDRPLRSRACGPDGPCGALPAWEPTLLRHLLRSAPCGRVASGGVGLRRRRGGRLIRLHRGFAASSGGGILGRLRGLLSSLTAWGGRRRLLGRGGRRRRWLLGRCGLRGRGGLRGRCGLLGRRRLLARWAAVVALAAAAGAAGAQTLLELLDLLGAVALGHHLALVDPALDADATGRRPRLDEAVG